MIIKQDIELMSTDSIVQSNPENTEEQSLLQWDNPIVIGSSIVLGAALIYGGYRALKPTEQNPTEKPTNPVPDSTKEPINPKPIEEPEQVETKLKFSGFDRLGVNNDKDTLYIYFRGNNLEGMIDFFRLKANNIGDNELTKLRENFKQENYYHFKLHTNNDQLRQNIKDILLKAIEIIDKIKSHPQAGSTNLLDINKATREQQLYIADCIRISQDMHNMTKIHKEGGFTIEDPLKPNPVPVPDSTEEPKKSNSAPDSTKEPINPKPIEESADPRKPIEKPGQVETKLKFSGFQTIVLQGLNKETEPKIKILINNLNFIGPFSPQDLLDKIKSKPLKKYINLDTTNVDKLKENLTNFWNELKSEIVKITNISAWGGIQIHIKDINNLTTNKTTLQTYIVDLLQLAEELMNDDKRKIELVKKDDNIEFMVKYTPTNKVKEGHGKIQFSGFENITFHDLSKITVQIKENVFFECSLKQLLNKTTSANYIYLDNINIEALNENTTDLWNKLLEIQKKNSIPSNTISLNDINTKLNEAQQAYIADLLQFIGELTTNEKQKIRLTNIGNKYEFIIEDLPSNKLKENLNISSFKVNNFTSISNFSSMNDICKSMTIFVFPNAYILKNDLKDTEFQSIIDKNNYLYLNVPEDLSADNKKQLMRNIEDLLTKIKNIKPEYKTISMEKINEFSPKEKAYIIDALRIAEAIHKHDFKIEIT
jgi:hypothetical protein